MLGSISFSVLTALSLFVASGIFLAQTIVQIKRKEKIFRSFNLLVTIFMLAWALSELSEELLLPPISIISHYLHLVVMLSFAVAITWRWRWSAEKAEA